jgi:2,4-dienoyl-CoA reductase-like NADH-dependent reductase (Old Yellow Enzyme family)
LTDLDESPAETADYDITPLLQPLQIRGLRLRNRFVMPGMQRYWCVDGAPDHRLRDYYRRRVLGGTSLVISESCAIDHPSATKNPRYARISPDTREAWRECVAGVHEAGGAMFLQLWHQGGVNYGGGRGDQPGLRRAEPVRHGAPGRFVWPRRHRGGPEEPQARFRPRRG